MDQGNNQYGYIPYTELITKTYPIEKLEQIKETRIPISLDYLKSQFDIECLRKTDRSEYVILMTDDRRLAFCFFDEAGYKEEMVITTGFMKKDVFQLRLDNCKTAADVMELDPNPLFLPVSAFDSTAHYVQEGAFVVIYRRPLPFELKENETLRLEKETIEKVTFVGNNDIRTGNDSGILIPYILECDRCIE